MAATFETVMSWVMLSLILLLFVFVFIWIISKKEKQNEPLKKVDYNQDEEYRVIAETPDGRFYQQSPGTFKKYNPIVF